MAIQLTKCRRGVLIVSPAPALRFDDPVRRTWERLDERRRSLPRFVARTRAVAAALVGRRSQALTHPNGPSWPWVGLRPRVVLGATGSWPVFSCASVAIRVGHDLLRGPRAQGLNRDSSLLRGNVCSNKRILSSGG